MADANKSGIGNFLDSISGFGVPESMKVYKDIGFFNAPIDPGYSSGLGFMPAELPFDFEDIANLIPEGFETKKKSRSDDIQQQIQGLLPQAIVPNVIPNQQKDEVGIKPTVDIGGLYGSTSPAFESKGRGTPIIEEAPVQEKFGQITVPEDERFRNPESDTMETAFAEAMENYIKMLRGTDAPAPQKKDIEYYKKEFAEATGIDPTGKVDKSDALMAFGLALMQNRAGKGFNVSRMLRSVGKAGEKAQPLLTKAKAQAKAEKDAAGKYALDQIKADENARAASTAAHLAHKREMQLKEFEAELESKYAAKESPDLKAPFTREFQVGAKPLKVPYVQMTDGKGGYQAVFNDGYSTSIEVKNRYKDATDGYSLTTELKTVLTALDQQSKGQLGGDALNILFGRGKTFLSTLGIVDRDSLFDDKTYKFILDTEGKEAAEKYANNRSSLENTAEVLQDALMARFKRFMTQETGNGIAVYDVESSKILTGKINPFGNLAKNLQYIDQLQGLFGHSVDTLDDVIVQLYDKDYHMNDKAYQKTSQNLDNMMRDIYGDFKITSDTASSIDVSDNLNYNYTGKGQSN